MKKLLSKPLYLALFLLSIATYAYFYVQGKSPTINPGDIASFEECAAAGYPVMETYPETCRVPGGELYTRVTTDMVPTPIKVEGLYTCLPKVDTGGPVTLECAFGLQSQDGYYSLDMSAIMTDNYPMLYGNESITVEGMMVPKEMLSSDRWATYDVIGVIAVEKLTLEQ